VEENPKVKVCTHRGGIMEAFGIIGMSLGTMGFIYGIMCYQRIEKLTKTLKDKGILDADYKCK